MAEEFLIKIIPDGIGGAGAGAEGAGALAGAGDVGGGFAGIGKTMKGAFGGAMKALGIGSLVGIIISVVSTFRSLLSVVSSIFKLIGLLLQPIANVVTTLLMPILFILKPFVILLNQVFAPFMKLAMQMMRQGAQKIAGGDIAGGGQLLAGAATVLLGGIQAIILTLTSSVLKLLLQGIISITSALIAPILKFFGVTQEQITAGTQALMEGVGGLVDELTGVGVALIANIVSTLAESTGADTSQFRLDVANMINDVFLGEKGLTPLMLKLLGFEEGFGKTATEKTTAVALGLTTHFNTEFDAFKTSGVNKISEVVSAFNSEMQKLIFGGGGGGIRGAISKAARFAGDLFLESQTYGLIKTKTFG